MTYELDVTKPFGQRIQNLKFKGQPLSPTQKLRVVTNNYRVNGGGGYTMYKERARGLSIQRRSARVDYRLGRAQQDDPHARRIIIGGLWVDDSSRMYAEAIATYQQSIRIFGDNTSDQIYLGAAYAKGRERGKAKAILKRLETTKDYVSPTELAILYAALDERDKAFATLERAYARHDYQFMFLGAPEFDSLRSDPRFADLRRRVGLPN